MAVSRWIKVDQLCIGNTILLGLKLRLRSSRFMLKTSGSPSVVVISEWSCLLIFYRVCTHFIYPILFLPFAG